MNKWMKLCFFCMIISLVGCAKTYHYVVRPTIMLAGLPIRLTIDAVKYPVGVVMQTVSYTHLTLPTKRIV